MVRRLHRPYTNALIGDVVQIALSGCRPLFLCERWALRVVHWVPPRRFFLIIHGRGAHGLTEAGHERSSPRAIVRSSGASAARLVCRRAQDPAPSWPVRDPMRKSTLPGGLKAREKRPSTICCPAGPTGKSLLIFSNHVKPQNQKYFGFRSTQIRCISFDVLSHQRGDRASSRARGGMRWTQGRQARKAIAGRDEPRERYAACRMIGAFCVR